MSLLLFLHEIIEIIETIGNNSQNIICLQNLIKVSKFQNHTV
jgi:hypothetical protein